MQYLNIIYFLILTGLGYRYLLSDGKVLKGTLNPSLSFKYNGVELFWCLTFATGVVALSVNVGLDLMALRLFVLEIFCLIGMNVAKNKVVLSFPLKIFIAYLIWMVIGLFYSPAPVYGIRTILKYLYPLLLCLFASAAVSDSEVFFKSSKWARIVGCISAIFGIFPFIERLVVPGVIWYDTARAINYISLMTFSLGMFYFTNKKRENLLWSIFFLLPCFIWSYRTSILGSGIAISAFYLIKYRVKALPIIFGVYILAIVAIFTIPSLRNKMFYDPSKVTMEEFAKGNFDEDNIDTNYRAKMWEVLQNKFYVDHKWTGSGTGIEQWEMYTHSKEYGGLKICHSDFVQQKCDNGLIGLILYGAMVLFIFLDCLKTYHSRFSAPVRLCAIVAGASLLGVYATFYSDNTVNYSMCTLAMPFGFYGMMLGMRRKEKEEGVTGG